MLFVHNRHKPFQVLRCQINRNIQIHCKALNTLQNTGHPAADDKIDFGISQSQYDFP